VLETKLGWSSDLLTDSERGSEQRASGASSLNGASGGRGGGGALGEPLLAPPSPQQQQQQRRVSRSGGSLHGGAEYDDAALVREREGELGQIHQKSRVIQQVRARVEMLSVDDRPR
jgi:hypothetical protein